MVSPVKVSRSTKVTSRPSANVKAILSRLSKMTGSLGGLDACLMLAQYTSPFIIALLLRLARLRSSLASRAAPGSSKIGGGVGLERTAAGLGNAAAGISDARVIMRAFGLLPVLLGLSKLHPNPAQSFKSLPRTLAGPKGVPTIQALSLVGYYSLEHLAWLGGKGVLDVSLPRIRRMAVWSVRCWAVYVFLELYNLNQSYSALKTRTRAIKLAKPSVSVEEAEGYEVPPGGGSTSPPSSEKTGGVSSGEQQQHTAAATAATAATAQSSSDTQLDKQRLRDDWDTWRLASLSNWSYAPLTLHWSIDGGLWTNPFITSGLGTMAAVGKVLSQWRSTEA